MGVLDLEDPLGEPHQLSIQLAAVLPCRRLGPLDELRDLEQGFEVLQRHRSQHVTVQMPGHLEDRRRARLRQLETVDARRRRRTQTRLDTDLLECLSASHRLTHDTLVEVHPPHGPLSGQHLDGHRTSRLGHVHLGAGHPGDREHHIDLGARKAAAFEADRGLGALVHLRCELAAGRHDVRVEVAGSGLVTGSSRLRAKVGEERRVVLSVDHVAAAELRRHLRLDPLRQFAAPLEQPILEHRAPRGSHLAGAVNAVQLTQEVLRLGGAEQLDELRLGGRQRLPHLPVRVGRLDLPQQLRLSNVVGQVPAESVRRPRQRVIWRDISERDRLQLTDDLCQVVIGLGILGAERAAARHSDNRNRHEPTNQDSPLDCHHAAPDVSANTHHTGRQQHGQPHAIGLLRNAPGG